jgi:uncharacterized membrane protein YkvI
MKSPLVRHAATYGLYIGLVLIVLALFSNLLFDQQNKAFDIISTWLIPILGIAWATIQYRDKEKGGLISYGDSVGYGTLLALFYGIVSAVFTVILVTVIDPGYMERVMELTRITLEDSGLYSDQQLDVMMAWTEKLSTPPILFAFGVIGSVIIGVIISLIASIFIKRNKPMFS